MNCRSNRSTRFCLYLILSLVLIVAEGKIAYAQYWGLGYGYYGLGSSLLWPLLYLGNRSLFSSNYGLYGSNYQYQPYNGIYNYPNYNNGSNYYNNLYGNRQLPSTYYLPQNQQNLQGTNAANDIFNSNIPPTAPDRRVIPGQTTTDQAADRSPQNLAALNSFFQAVNVHYRGDLFKALRQPDMRSWAQSIGLINPQQPLPIHINKSRQTEISVVLRDNSLDACAKLQLLRLLVK